MASTFEQIDDKLAAWLEDQPVYFVATAPLASDGRVNVSPKGMTGTFRVLGPHRVAYLDYHASGTETVAHLREPDNGRICLMFCSFVRRPRIIRLHGHGRMVRRESAEFAELRTEFAKERTVGQRAIIVVDVERVSDSCGWTLPFLEYAGERDTLDRHQERKGVQWYADYDENKNAYSIDGLPAMTHTEP